MRIPNPIATTTTEAYLAYKAGVLAQADLKEKLYHPYIHIDGWLAYWTGLTDTYPTDKNGDPECLTDEEAYIAYLAGATSEYPEALKDPADPRMAGYLKYLISARFGRPNYPVTREELYLSMLKPPVVPSGDPSSSIDLEGTVEAPFISMEMYGDTYQKSYSGKNLFDVQSYYDGIANDKVAATVALNNGNIEWTNTTNDSYFPSMYSNSQFPNHKNDAIKVEPNTTYTLSLAISASMGSSRVYVYEGDAEYNGVDNDHEKPLTQDFTLTFTTSANTHYIIIRMARWESTSHAITISNIQLEKSSTATSFEPYVGGISSPNPDYPQAVNTVTGRQVVKVEGKNLLEVIDTTSNGIITTNSDGRMLMSGTATDNWAWATGQTSKNIPAGDYILSIQSATTHSVDVRLYFEDGTNDTFAIGAGETSKSFTTSKNAVSYAILYGGIVVNTEYSETIELQLEEGSTATEFVPYEVGSYEINLGKNLANTKLLGSGRVNNIDYSVLDDGSVRIVGTATASTHIGLQYKIPQSLLGKSLVQSWSGDFSDMGNVSLKNGATDVGGIATLNKNSSSATFVVTQSMIDAVNNVDFWVSSGHTVDATIKYQLELGDTATDYAPYFEPIELCKIGDYQDYIYRDGEDWYVHKAVNKLIFDASDDEEWGLATSSRFYCNANLYSGGVLPANDQAKVDMFCNSLIARSYQDAWNNITNYSVSARHDGNANPRIINQDYTTLAEFKNWLAENPVLLYYPLATATDTIIEKQALIAQLDALMEGGSYDGETHIRISATDPNLPALLKVEAGKA